MVKMHYPEMNLKKPGSNPVFGTLRESISVKVEEDYWSLNGRLIRHGTM